MRAIEDDDDEGTFGWLSRGRGVGRREMVLRESGTVLQSGASEAAL